MSARFTDDMTFGAIIALFKDGWGLMLKSVCGAVVAVLLYLHLATFTYTITLQLTPVDTTTPSPSALSGLADVVGLGTGQNTTNFVLYKTALQSSMAAEAVARQPGLMHLIFWNGWSEKEKRWLRGGPGPIGLLKNGVKYLIGIPVPDWAPPGPLEVKSFLEKQLSVDLDRRSQTIMLTLQWRDPAAGKQILIGVSELVDTVLRQRDLVRAQNYGAYAADELKRSNTIEYREALAQLLVQQEKRKMIASANLPFAAQALGGPVASATPTNPPSGSLVILSIPAGIFIGLALSYLQRLYGRGWLVARLKLALRGLPSWRSLRSRLAGDGP